MSRSKRNAVPFSAAEHTNVIDFVSNTAASGLSGDGGAHGLVAGPPAYLQIDQVVYVPQEPKKGLSAPAAKPVAAPAPRPSAGERVDAFMASLQRTANPPGARVSARVVAPLSAPGTVRLSSRRGRSTVDPPKADATGSLDDRLLDARIARLSARVKELDAMTADRPKASSAPIGMQDVVLDVPSQRGRRRRH